MSILNDRPFNIAVKTGVAANLTPDIKAQLVSGQPLWITDILQFCLGNSNASGSVNTLGVSYRNILSANGGLEVWQRGSGATASIAVAVSTTVYTADRWYITTGANQQFTVANASGLTLPSQCCAKVQRNSGQTGNTVVTFGYPLTSDECIKLRGQFISFQFVGATGANWSPSSGTLNYDVYFGTGSEAKRGGGFTGETHPITGSINFTTSATATLSTVTGSAAVATTVTQGEMQFTFTPTGTAGANDWVELDDVQLEPQLGCSVFERPSFSESMMECKRHFVKTFPYNTAPLQSAGLTGAIGAPAAGAGGIALEAFAMWRFPISMRSSPSITTYNPSNNNANWRDVTGAADVAVTVDPDSTISPDVVCIQSHTASVNADNVYIHAIADAGI
jgi:hypothetical protein